MKLIIVTDNSTVVETVEDFGLYNLDSPYAREGLIQTLQDAQVRGKEMERVGD